MNEGMAKFEQFLVTLPSAVVVAVCVLLVVHRIIDGQIHWGVGIGAIGLLLVTLWFCVWPPHPAVPAIALVSIIALMITFPFAERQLELIEEREYDVGRLERAFGALQQKADNPSAMFEAANWLHRQGFVQDAIAIGESALAALSLHRDEVRNTSLRDQFRGEAALLDRWKRESFATPGAVANECKACRTVNPPGTLFCLGCKRPYLLDKVKLVRFRERFMGKLVLTWCLMGGMVVVGSAIGLVLEGVLRYVALGAAVAVVGGVLAWLFRIRKFA